MGFQNSLNKKNYIHQEVYSQNFQKQSLEDQGWHMAAEVFSGIFCPNHEAAQQRTNCCNIVLSISYKILNRFF